ARERVRPRLGSRRRSARAASHRRPRRGDPRGRGRAASAWDLPVTDVVREAMVSNPGRLPADATAQAAGELLQRTEVRAIYVTDDEQLVGVVTRKTLVREVVAQGLDPGRTELRSIAEEPHLTIGPDVPLEEAFRFLETEDAERVPVVDDQ